jgi:general secretion pathway protein A
MLAMYETHFGLKQRPFCTTADSEFYYPATCHEQALAQLLQAVDDDEGFALLTGEPGTGKTILCHRLLDRLAQDVATAYLSHGQFGDRRGLLQSICFDVDLPYEGRTEQELRLALTELLIKNYESPGRTVLVIDEAQALTVELLEELRLLGNLEGRHGKALQMILAAQPSFVDLLNHPALTSLTQRLAVRTQVEPLGLHEAADYLVYHLRSSGGKAEEIASDEALEILARGTRGIPRLLNRAAHHALMLACASGAELLDAEVALETLASLGLAMESDVASPQEHTTASCPEASADAVGKADGNLSGESVITMGDSVTQSEGRDRQLDLASGRARFLVASPRRPA